MYGGEERFFIYYEHFGRRIPDRFKEVSVEEGEAAYRGGSSSFDPRGELASLQFAGWKFVKVLASRPFPNSATENGSIPWRKIYGGTCEAVERNISRI